MSETSLPWLKHYPEGFPAEINPDRFASIPALFDTVAETYGDKPAFICMNKVLTYREICDLSKDFAGYLQSLPDMKPGDRVAIMMPNLQQYIISLLGILRAGMIAVNVNPLYTSHELGHQLADSGAKAIIIIENFAKTLQNTLSETPVKHIVTTKVGDMLPWLKRTAADFVVRYVKRWSRNLISPVTSTSARRFQSAARKALLRWNSKHRRCAAAVHRRHHGCCQGRHAHAPQRACQRRTDGHLDQPDV